MLLGTLNPTHSLTDNHSVDMMIVMTMTMMHYCHKHFVPPYTVGVLNRDLEVLYHPVPDTEPPLQSQKLHDGEKSSRRKEHSVTKRRVAVSQTDGLLAVAVNIICQMQLATCSRPAARQHQMIHNVTEFRDTWSLLRTKLTDLPNDLCSRTINRRQ